MNLRESVHMGVGGLLLRHQGSVGIPTTVPDGAPHLLLPPQALHQLGQVTQALPHVRQLAGSQDHLRYSEQVLEGATVWVAAFPMTMKSWA